MVKINIHNFKCSCIGVNFESTSDMFFFAVKVPVSKRNIKMSYLKNKLQPDTWFKYIIEETLPTSNTDKLTSSILNPVVETKV